MNVCIVIPAWNEEKRIGRTLEEYGKFYKKVTEKAEILVVINNTQDRTEEVVREYMKKFSNIRFLNFKRGGKGFAIIEGFKYALEKKFDLIGFVDADCSTSADSFYDLVKKIGDSEGIIASRYLPGAVIKPKQPFSRIIASRIFNFLVRSLFFFNFRDTQCGAKLFTKKSLEKVIDRLKITLWAFDVDILYNMKKEGFSVKEIPTTWKDSEESKINLKKASIQMFFAVIQLRLMRSRTKRLLSPLSKPIGYLWRMLK